MIAKEALDDFRKKLIWITIFQLINRPLIEYLLYVTFITADARKRNFI